MVNKILKIISFFFAGILLLPVIFYLAFKNPGVQLYITKRITSYLSGELKTKIRLNSIQIRPFSSVVLEGLYVEDQRGDTLAFINELDADIRLVELAEKKIDLSKITIFGARFNLAFDSAGVHNLQFIPDYFLALLDTTDTLPGWKLRCRSLDVDDSRFTLKFTNPDKREFGINFQDLCLDHIFVKLTDIIKIGDSLSFSIADIQCVEKSGFRLLGLKANAEVVPTHLALNHLAIKAPNTTVNADTAMVKYSRFDDVYDFVNKVSINFILDSAKADMQDLRYFAPDLDGMEQNIRIAGTIKGQVPDLRGKNIDLRFGDNSKLAGNFTINGLPDINQAYIHFTIKKLSTDKADLEQIPLPPFKEKNHLILPPNIALLGKINYSGSITGFINDFVAYGTLTTHIGNLASDISIKQDTASGKLSFSGKLKSENFNLGKFTNNALLGNVSMDANINGSNTATMIQAKLDGVVNSFDLNSYSYKNIKVDGELTNNKFDGTLSINDPNIKMEFYGRCDFSGKVPVFDFTSDVSGANLYALNLDKSDSLTRLSFLLTAKFEGSNIDNSLGKVELFNTTLVRKEGSIHIDELTLTANNISDSLKNLTLLSDIADAEISGNFNSTTLPGSLQEFITVFIPSFGAVQNETRDTVSHTNIFSFKGHLKKPESFCTLFIPAIQISKNTKFSGEYNSLTKNLALNCTCPLLTTGGRWFKEITLAAKTNGDKLSADIGCRQLLLDSAMCLDNFKATTESQNDSIRFSAHWQNQDTSANSGNLELSALFTRPPGKKRPTINIRIDPSHIVLAGVRWEIASNKILIDSNAVHINTLTIISNKQFFKLSGNISENIEDTLRLNFNEFDLSYLNVLTAEKGITVGGLLSGSAKLNNVYKNLVFYSDTKVDSLVINNEKFGNFYISSAWDLPAQKIQLNAYTNRGSIRTFSVKGDYFPSTGKLDFVVSLDKLRLSILEPYLQGKISELYGIASGDINVNGTLQNLTYNGRLKLQKTAFVFDYLNTRYNFTNYVDIRNDLIEFKDIEILDVNGNIAKATGKIVHNNFKDIKFDITLDAKNFMFLNTSEKDNSMYYGKAFATGVINLTGTPSDVNIDISAKTEKNTKFFIPLSSGSEISEDNNFISFVKKDTINSGDSTHNYAYKVNLEGIKLNFDLEVTPDAEVQIIFDSKAGDIIKATGAGNLKMEINTLGNFNMYGEYIIDEGDYLFTLQNVINKRFAVEKGGMLKWNGSPYDAYVDLNAVYRLKTPLYDLLLDSSEMYKKRIPVECLLKMSNSLTQPDIKFDINIPSADDKAVSVLKSLSEDDLNKQILSLLVLGRFYTPDNLRGQESASTDSKNALLGANSSELLSNQLSNWLSQISNDFDIGVNYRPGDQISKDELEVALSTQLFNDRVSVNGNVGVGGQQTNSSNLVGDVNVDVKLNKSGKLRVKGYTKANDNKMLAESSDYTQGLGVFYKEEFNSVGELLSRYWRKIFPAKSDTTNVTR